MASTSAHFRQAGKEGVIELVNFLRQTRLVGKGRAGEKSPDFGCSTDFRLPTLMLEGIHWRARRNSDFRSPQFGFQAGAPGERSSPVQDGKGSMQNEGLSSAESVREFLREWLGKLSPELRRRISSAGVEVNPNPDGPTWGVRISLLSLEDQPLFNDLPEDLPKDLPRRFIQGPVFRRLVIPSLLLVDDNAEAIASMSQMLAHDLDVVAVDPQVAYASARSIWRDRPDLWLAVVDLSMPASPHEKASVETGFQLIREMRVERPEACVIVHSAYGTPEIQQRAQEYGAVEFLLRDAAGQDKVERILHYSHAAGAAGAAFGPSQATLQH